MPSNTTPDFDPEYHDGPAASSQEERCPVCSRWNFPSKPNGRSFRCRNCGCDYSRGMKLNDVLGTKKIGYGR